MRSAHLQRRLRLYRRPKTCQASPHGCGAVVDRDPPCAGESRILVCFPLRATLLSSGLARQLALELLLCAVHVPPGVATGTVSLPALGLTHGQAVTALATVPLVLRLHLARRLYLNYARYTSQRCARAPRRGRAAARPL